MWLAIACSLVIFVAGSLPSSAASAPQISDKVLHAVGFGVLGALWCRAFARGWPQAETRVVALAAFVASTGLGGLLELWQGLLGYRSREWLDWVADAIGAAIAALLWIAWRRLARAQAS